jgi:catechol 2,3-dioxygenase-like lactoylglutathione lyase family enzyme
MSVIDHVTIRVSHLERSRRFYEQAFHPLGYRIASGEAPYFWAFDVGKGLFEIAQYKGNGPLTSCHVALRVESRRQVHDFHDAAIAAGAEDNGAPGPRPQYTENYYASFILDPDGHNIEAVFDTWK